MTIPKPSPDFEAFDVRPLEQLLDALPLGIIRAGPDGRILFGNREAARFLGYRCARDLVRDPPAFAPADRDVVLQELRARRPILDLPVYFVRPDGHRALCLLTARPEAGQPRMQTLAGVIRPAGGDRAPLPAQPPAPPTHETSRLTVVLDPQGKILNINAAGAAFFQLDKASLVGKPVGEVILPVYQDLFGLFLADVLQGSRKSGIVTIRGDDARRRLIEFHASVEDRPGGGRHVLCSARDVTPDPDQEDGAAAERFRGAQEIAGGVAHRMNQPLTLIRNLVHDLSGCTGPDDPRLALVQAIDDQVRKLDEIRLKIRNLIRYEVMDYVAGVKIFDVDRAG